MKILEGAIRCYSSVGITKSTPEKIAQESGVSRPLVLHYFKDSDEIFEKSMEYIRMQFQSLVVESIANKRSPSTILKAYTEACFDWVEQRKSHAQLWALFFYYCTLKNSMKEAHSHWVQIGESRISLIIEQGKKEKEFTCHSSNILAKQIQNLITGTLTCLMTENLSPQKSKEIKDQAIKLIFLMLGKT